MTAEQLQPSLFIPKRVAAEQQRQKPLTREEMLTRIVIATAPRRWSSEGWRLDTATRLNHDWSKFWRWQNLHRCGATKGTMP